MLKPMLLATSMLFAIPAFAQEAPEQDNSQAQQSAPAQDQSMTPATDDKAPGAQDAAPPAATAETTAPAQAATQPAQPAPAQGVAQETGTAAPAAQPMQSAAAPNPAQAPATPAATQEQVAQAVGRDFGSYDKDADGKLSQAEFTDWMASLRKAAEPTFQPGSAEATSWGSQAFASADADKNASINKQELTMFLTPKQPA